MSKKFRLSMYPGLLLFAMLICAKSVEGAESEFISFKLAFGLKDEEPADWSGNLTFVDPANQSRIRGAKRLAFRPQESMINFRISSRQVNWEGSSYRESISWLQETFPVSPYTILITCKIRGTPVINVTTAEHGGFTFATDRFRPGERKQFLDGQVMIERIIPGVQVMELRNESAPFRYNNFPSVCATSDGAIYIAYVSTVGMKSPYVKNGWPIARMEEEITDFSSLAQPYGGDQIMVVREKDGIYSAPTGITEPGKDIFTAAIISDNDDRLWTAWSEQVSGNWDIYLKCCENGSWGSAIRVTEAPGPDIYPTLASDGRGAVYLLWQGFRGDNSDILCVIIDSGTKMISREKGIGQSPANEWEPAVAIDSKGSIAVAWDTYKKGDYDIYYAVCSQHGQFSEPIPVAASLRFEARPSMVYDNQGRLWIAWEEAGKNWGKNFGTEGFVDISQNEGIWKERSIRVRCFKDGKVFLTPERVESIIPKDQMFLRDAVPGHFINSPVLCQDGSGGICLVYRHQEDVGTTRFWSIIWANYLTRFDGEKWCPPSYIGGSDGQSYQKPSVVQMDNGIAIAYGADSRASTPEKDICSNYNVWLAKPVFEAASPFRLFQDSPIVVSEPERAAIEEAEAVNRCMEFRSVVGTKTYRVIRGEFHRHTTFSKDGGTDGTVADLFKYSLDAGALDWVGPGDHNHNYDEYTHYIVYKYLDAFLVPDAFTTMFSYERSRDWPQGHRNVMLSKRNVLSLPGYSAKQSDPGGPTPNTQFLYKYLHFFNGISAPHTIGNNQGTDWRDSDPVAEPIVEIYQGARHSYEYMGAPRTNPNNEKYKAGTYWSALSKGLKLGITSSSDHHSTHISYTMIFIEKPTREGIIRELRNRHCYGATDNIILEVKMGNHMMGDVFKSDVPARLEIHAIGAGAIRAIDIMKNCRIVHTFRSLEEETHLLWEDENPGEGESHYYVRVLQENGELAWGSPMWITYVK